jgi:hypothetical protein
MPPAPAGGVSLRRKKMNKTPIMKENEFSIIGKVSSVLLVLFFIAAAGINAWRGHVPHPYAFIVVLIGLALFIAAKISNLRKGKIISFGTTDMSEGIKNLYRLGY